MKTKLENNLAQTAPAKKNTLTRKHPSSPKHSNTNMPHGERPNPNFFTQLKAEERKQFASKQRRRFKYEDNYSAALNLPYSDEQLATQHNDQNSYLTLSKENIMEHASRRVDLFFYTLIAYYNTGILPIYGHTTLQHGKGRTMETNTIISEACHSSFTPSLVDSTIYKGQEGKKHKCLLSGTHFMENLNSTVELPTFANDLDDVLENACKEKILLILRKVSLGKIDPIVGLSQFLQMMSSVLKNLKEDTGNKSKSALSSQSLMGQCSINPTLIDLVIKGTLSTTYSPETKSANDAYIQTLLRLTPEEKTFCKNETSKEEFYMKKIMELQTETLHTKSSRIPSP